MAKEGLTSGGLALRFFSALALVYATFNPTGYSFYHWALWPLFHRSAPAAVSTSGGGPAALKVLVGLLLFAGWVVFVQATKRSLGLLGAFLALAISAAGIWLLVSWRVFAVGGNTLVHIGLIVVSVILTAGLSWSHFTRKLTGQQDTDTVG
jgi:hypothetical protein